MPFEGDYTQEQYAQQMIDEYKAAGDLAAQGVRPVVQPRRRLYWLQHEPEFGTPGRLPRRSGRRRRGYDAAVAGMPDVAGAGRQIIAPPMWALVTARRQQRIVPSTYAHAAKAAGLDIITWTLERSGPLATGGGYYFQSVTSAIDNDGDTFRLLDVLAKQVGVIGVFSDWPATVTYYANCFGL